MSTSPQPRPAIAQIPPYVAGRPPAPRADLTTYKLSSNLVVPNQNTTAVQINVDNVTPVRSSIDPFFFKV